MAYTIQQIKTALELYDKLKKIVPTVRQLGYPSVHTLYEWINQREATGGKFPDIEPLGVSKRHLKVKMNHDGFSAEHKLKILKRCFEGTENIESSLNEIDTTNVLDSLIDNFDNLHEIDNTNFNESFDDIKVLDNNLDKSFSNKIEITDNIIDNTNEVENTQNSNLTENLIDLDNIGDVDNNKTTIENDENVEDINNQNNETEEVVNTISDSSFIDNTLKFKEKISNNNFSLIEEEIFDEYSSFELPKSYNIHNKTESDNSNIDDDLIINNDLSNNTNIENSNNGTVSNKTESEDIFDSIISDSFSEENNINSNNNNLTEDNILDDISLEDLEDAISNEEDGILDINSAEILDKFNDSPSNTLAESLIIDKFAHIDNTDKLDNIDNIDNSDSKINETLIDHKSNTAKYNVDTSKYEKKIAEILSATTDNNDLVISERTGKIYLPYSTEELLEYIENYPDVYSSLSDVVNQEFVLSFEYFINHPIKARLEEAYNLIKNREHKSSFEAFKYALKISKMDNLNPAIIAACKNEYDLNNYIYHLNSNSLNKFKTFNIFYDINP